MKLKDFIDILASKDGFELYDKIEETLKSFGIDVKREDGTMKNLQEICWEVGEVLNKGK